MGKWLSTLALVLLTALPGLAGANSEAPILVASADMARYLPSPDGLIAKTLQDIRSNRLDDALREVNRVISLRPDFKLAHLIKGDLLMARSRPLSGIGTMTSRSATSAQSLSDLRDEARVRLLRYIDQPDPALLPRQILQLAAEQKYALLADASRARLYLFENVNGEPRLKADFYMTIGKNGTDKRTEGDKRTPMGIYQIARELPRKSLADLYGAGAFPLDYPNEWDRTQGRSGHGIWLHGVPSDTYSRPPRSSDGCVVVTNPDLKEISRWVQPGATPVVLADRTDWIDRESWEQARNDLLAQLQSWQASWQEREADRFLGHYASDFLNGEGRVWSENKRRNITDKTWIKVELEDISLFLYPGVEDGKPMAYAEFTQRYSSDRLSSVSRKRLYWQLDAGHWRIVMEKTSELPTRLAQR
ncbi:MAG: L,D-transpeptidase family protein [Gallionellaceae bacterium]|nr:L,D-transpeptidase family protein [Gallionellaceae bacterium]